MPGFSRYQEPGESTLCPLAFFAKGTFSSPSAAWLDKVMLCPDLLPGVLPKWDPWSQQRPHTLCAEQIFSWRVAPSYLGLLNSD